MTKLLVASGEYPLASVEVINLDTLIPNSTCLNLPNLPIPMQGATGQLFKGTPVICGGQKTETLVSNNCFGLRDGN